MTYTSSAWEHRNLLTYTTDYRIRDGDPLSYLLTDNKYDSIEFSWWYLWAYVTPVQETYAISVRAKNMKGWGAYSAETNAAQSLSASITWVTSYLTLSYPSNILSDSSQTISVEIRRVG